MNIWRYIHVGVLAYDTAGYGLNLRQAVPISRSERLRIGIRTALSMWREDVRQMFSDPVWVLLQLGIRTTWTIRRARARNERRAEQTHYREVLHLREVCPDWCREVRRVA